MSITWSRSCFPILASPKIYCRGVLTSLSTQNLWCCGLVYPGTMSLRWRGMARRRTSMFPDANYGHCTITEDAIEDELENGNHCLSECIPAQMWHFLLLFFVTWHLTEEQDLVKELVALSTQERVQAIRDLPKSFEEKQNIRCVATAKINDSTQALSCSKLTITLGKEP